VDLLVFEDLFFSLDHCHQRLTIAWSTRRTASEGCGEGRGSPSKKNGWICNKKNDYRNEKQDQMV
jgi:hypothetical protein